MKKDEAVKAYRELFTEQNARKPQWLRWTDFFVTAFETGWDAREVFDEQVREEATR